MIPSPSADFSTEEARTIGAWPFFKFTIYPNYFRTGIGAGLGTFTDCSFVSPDRILVDDGVTTASWVSGVLTANVSDFPALATFTLVSNSPGYDVILKYRTNSIIDLSGDPWLDLHSGDSINLQQYYQWESFWTGYRAWAYDTLEEAEASGISAWAIDAVDPEDPYQSYASDASAGDIDSYIETAQFAGELRIPERDVLSGGSLSLSADNDFSSLISSDHTMQLINRDNQYSPRHANFIFKDENDWQRKNLRIEFGFKIHPDGFWGLPWGDDYGEGERVETEMIVLYKGQILKWGPIPVAIDSSSYDAGQVEIYSRDTIALCMERLIGIPKADGIPNPLITGRILREATALGDNSPDDPVKDVDFESASILTEMDTIDESGAGNVIELSSVSPYSGNQCLRSYVETAGYARGWINYPTTSDNILFRTAINFVYVPNIPIHFNMDFLRIRSGDADKMFLEVTTDYKVFVNVAGMTPKETDWDIRQGQGIWQDLVIGVYGKNPGVLRISINGDQVLNWEDLDLSILNNIQMVSLGLNTAMDEIWEINYDDVRLYNRFYPEAYYIPGGPFHEIGAVYEDGYLKIKKGEAAKYAPGRAVSEVAMTKYPEKGMVTFDDLANPPNDSIYFMIRKDDNDHPTDALTEILSGGDLDNLIDSDSFVAAKVAYPNDTIGTFFDNVTMAEAILGICQRNLIGFVVSQGEIKLISYDGTAPTSSDWQIDASMCAGLSSSDDSESKKNKVSVKWGWYDMNSRLFYAAQDNQSIAKLGVLEEQIDFTWGNDVGSDNSEMVKNRADCLLNRLKGSSLVYEDMEVLPWKFVRAEIGDTAQVNIPYFGSAEIFRIMGKDLELTPPYSIRLTLAMFPGES